MLRAVRSVCCFVVFVAVLGFLLAVLSPLAMLSGSRLDWWGRFTAVSLVAGGMAIAVLPWWLALSPCFLVCLASATYSYVAVHAAPDTLQRP